MTAFITALPSEAQPLIKYFKLILLNDNVFKIYKKDNHSRRGLVLLVSQRKKLLSYVKSNDITSYANLISRLGIRK